jgi:predicted amidophosphoribosyltransferase
VTAASAYGGWLRDALIDYKNGSRRRAYGLAQVVHRLMLTIEEPERLTFVPMPSSPAKIAQRGFDTICLLLQEAMKIHPRPQGWVNPALQLTREVADQVGLSAAERQQNVDRSMTVTQEMTGTVLLLDDVITTGATMCEAARVLRLAGANKVFGISLCGSSKWG